MIDEKQEVMKFSTFRFLAFFTSLVLFISACGSENNSSEDALLKDMETKTEHDHSGHDHGEHDHSEHVHHTDEVDEVPDASFEVEILGGKVKGGLPRFEVSKGDVVEITVYSDQKDEVHLHVYDNMANVGPDISAKINVRATIPGIFEAELHSAGFRIFELQVS